MTKSEMIEAYEMAQNNPNVIKIVCATIVDGGDVSSIATTRVRDVIDTFCLVYDDNLHHGSEYVKSICFVHDDAPQNRHTDV